MLLAIADPLCAAADRQVSGVLERQPYYVSGTACADPGPLDPTLVTKVDVVFAAGKVSNTFAPSTTLAAHLTTLRSLYPPGCRNLY